MIYRFFLGSLAAAGLAQPACAYDVNAKVALDPLITRHAKANDVPPALVHRIIMRESRYNARAVGRGGTLGLMQIKHGTARALGYAGGPEGLLDPDTNLAFGVRYLAGAYRVANGDQNRAVGYFARGYYYDAKRRGLHRVLAQRPVVVEEPPAAAPAPATPPAQPPSLFALIFAPRAQSAQEVAPAVEQPAVEEQPASPASPNRRRRAAAASAGGADQVAGGPERPGQRRRTSAVATPAAAGGPAATHAGRDDGRMVAEETGSAVRRGVRPSKRAGAADANRSARKASAQPDDPGRSP